jgi:hypothetical protein
MIFIIILLFLYILSMSILIKHHCEFRCI